MARCRVRHYRSFVPAPDRQVFRPRLELGLAVALAALLWCAALGYLLAFGGVPVETVLSAALFAAFFSGSVLYYVRTAIVLDPGGVTYRGMVRTQRFSFSDIRKVDVVPGFITVYAIRARGRHVHFTSFFRHHRRLMELLVERAGLTASA
ncbi:MAG: PH domain-containing protein [Myxococcota bacterium]